MLPVLRVLQVLRVLRVLSVVGGQAWPTPAYLLLLGHHAPRPQQKMVWQEPTPT